MHEGKLNCDRCKGTAVYKFGKDRSGYQKYRCLACHRQWAPENPGVRFLERKERGIKLSCPLCARPMYLFKSFPSYLRYRCAGYRDRKSHCAHKLNLYLGPAGDYAAKTSSLTFWESALGQKFLARAPFRWRQMKFSKATVGLALYYAIEKNIPATDAAGILKDQYGVSVSHDEVTYWSTKAAAARAAKFKDLRFNVEQDTLHTDETFMNAGALHLNQRGSRLTNRVAVWQTKARKSKAVTGISFSQRRNTDAAREHFTTVRETSTGKPAEFIQDTLWSYGPAFAEIYPEQIPDRITYRSIADEHANNPVERQHGILKSAARRYRGFKSVLGLVAFVVSRTIIWNYFKERAELGGLTPAEAAGVNLPSRPKRIIDLL